MTRKSSTTPGQTGQHQSVHVDAPKPKTVASTQARTVKLSLNAKQVLVGDYPAILDLRKYTFETEIFTHSYKEFNLAYKEGRPPQPNISISGSSSVEVLHLPGDAYDYAVVENLPNLKELHVHQGGWAGGGLTWLICQNLPRLERIVAKGACVKWLELENLPRLNSIDASGCDKLDYFSITKAPKIEVIKLDGCKKLSKIVGLGPTAQNRLGISKQIAAVQQSSRRDLKIYDDMTITDIEMVLTNINRGAKLAERRGPYRPSSHDVLKDESDCDQFGFNLLRPLEYVQTGNTGESYCYEFTEGDEHGVSSLGHHTPEDCLREALRSVASDLAQPFANAATEEQVLAYLNLLIAAPTSDPADWVKTEDVIMRRELAANPLMSAPALETMANDKDLKVRLAIAGNPATSDQVRTTVLNGLLKSKSPKVLEAIARNPASSEAVLRRLVESSHAKVLVAVAEHPTTPEGVRVSAIEMLATNVESQMRLAVAKNKATPSAVLAGLAEDKDLQVRQAVAEHPTTPGPIRIAVLSALGNESNLKVLVAVARNPATPATVLEALSKLQDRTLLEGVAANPGTLATVLEVLARNVNLGVRMAVACNPATPTATLDALAKDAQEEDEDNVGLVRQCVAGNPATSAATLGMLVRDERWFTRLAIADNPSTPAAAFETLAKDNNTSVRECAAKNPLAPLTALEILAKDRNANIRMCVARHRASSAAILTALSRDPDDVVRRYVATNPSTPNLVLKSLVTDGEYLVRMAAESALRRTFPV